jgi:ribosomal protein S27AE
MSTIKPVVFTPQPARALCPICGKATYSRGGIHPQCAMQQADAPRVVQIRAAKLAEAKIDKPKPMAAKKKKCPECDAQLDSRQQACACGFEFNTGRSTG